MKTLEESVVTAMDGADFRLFPFLPYILQDSWEIGSSPEVMIALVKKHMPYHSQLHILDLACGKGAVSVKLAKELKCNCLGIDAIGEFINEANKKAKEFNVDALCRFVTDDIRLKVKELSGFDVIILGSIGPVLGNYYETLTILSGCLNNNGIIIIDDGYISNESDYTHPFIQKRETILQHIGKAGMQLIDEVIGNRKEIKKADDSIFKLLKKRCNELIEKHPDKQELFRDYVRKQEEENEILETKIVCSAMVIKRNV